MFVLVFVSRDFEVGGNVTRKESTISPIGANLLSLAAVQWTSFGQW